MVGLRTRSGRLLRKDKKLALSDIRQIRKEANELARETKRDLFSSGKLTLREMQNKERQINAEINRLENLLKQIRANKEEYQKLKHTKNTLKAVKEKIKLEKKRRKYEKKLAKYNKKSK